MPLQQVYNKLSTVCTKHMYINKHVPNMGSKFLQESRNGSTGIPPSVSSLMSTRLNKYVRQYNVQDNN